MKGIATAIVLTAQMSAIRKTNGTRKIIRAREARLTKDIKSSLSYSGKDGVAVFFRCNGPETTQPVIVFLCN